MFITHHLFVKNRWIEIKRTGIWEKYSYYLDYTKIFLSCATWIDAMIRFQVIWKENVQSSSKYVKRIISVTKCCKYTLSFLQLPFTMGMYILVLIIRFMKYWKYFGQVDETRLMKWSEVVEINIRILSKTIFKISNYFWYIDRLSIWFLSLKGSFPTVLSIERSESIMKSSK